MMVAVAVSSLMNRIEIILGCCCCCSFLRFRNIIHWLIFDMEEIAI